MRKYMNLTNENTSRQGAGGSGKPEQVPMLELTDLTLQYPGRLALDRVSFRVASGESFGLLGPNGSGKSTLMRILAGLLAPSGGVARLNGMDVTRETAAVRNSLGVAFQTPSLDGKLSVRENLRFQGLLYGLSGAKLRQRVDRLMESFRITDRAKDRVEKLSGGLKRRVELAKSLLHKPPVLLLDEPSTGLDPAARQDFWRVLEEHRAQEALTVIVATHLMEEAENCHRVALLDQGHLVTVDSPDNLKSKLGHEVLTLESADPKSLAEAVRKSVHLEGTVNGSSVRLQTSEGMKLIPRLMESFPDLITAIRIGKPTLEDVFLARTGHGLNVEGQES